MTRLTVHPRNITVKIGDSAYLNCSAEPSAIHWKQGDKFVYTGELVDTYSARFRIEIDSKGARNLVITSVESGDAGKYICEEVGVGPELQKSEAELIVIGL